MHKEFFSIVSDFKQLLREVREEKPPFFFSATLSERLSPPPLYPPSSRSLPASPRFEPVAKKEMPAPVKKEAPPPLPSPVKKEATPEPAAVPSAFLVLQPLETSDSSVLEGRKEVRQRVQKLFPQWKLAEKTLSDEEAIANSSAWKIRPIETQILVLNISSSPEIIHFLQNFTNAIQSTLAPAQLIDVSSVEEKNMWSAVLKAPRLTAIYAPPLETWNAPRLLQHVKTLPATQENYLGSCPLYFLQKIESYLQDPSLKRLLWQELCRRHP